jgi:hypothetical protein
VPSDPPSLPSGRVTFAFVDVVGSTRTSHERGDAYVVAQRALHGREAMPLLDAQETNPEHGEDRDWLLAELPELRA